MPLLLRLECSHHDTSQNPSRQTQQLTVDKLVIDASWSTTRATRGHVMMLTREAAHMPSHALVSSLAGSSVPCRSVAAQGLVRQGMPRLPHLKFKEGFLCFTFAAGASFDFMTSWNSQVQTWVHCGLFLIQLFPSKLVFETPRVLTAGTSNSAAASDSRNVDRLMMVNDGAQRARPAPYPAPERWVPLATAAAMRFPSSSTPSKLP